MVPPQPQLQAPKAQWEKRFWVTMKFWTNRGQHRQTKTQVTAFYMDPEDRHEDRREKIFRNCEEKLHEFALRGMPGVSVRADFFFQPSSQIEAPSYYIHVFIYPCLLRQELGYNQCLSFNTTAHIYREKPLGADGKPVKVDTFTIEPSPAICTCNTLAPIIRKSQTMNPPHLPMVPQGSPRTFLLDLRFSSRSKHDMTMLATAFYIDPEDRHADRREEVFRNCEKELRKSASGGPLGKNFKLHEDCLRITGITGSQSPTYHMVVFIHPCLASDSGKELRQELGYNRSSPFNTIAHINREKPLGADGKSVAVDTFEMLIEPSTCTCIG